MGKVFIIFRSGISGGTATLSIRIGEYLVSQGHKVIYICQTINDENNLKTMEEKGVKICKWKLREIAKNLSKHYEGISFDVLTYSLDEFLFIEELRKKIRINRNILYVVHHYGLIKGKNKKNIFMKYIKSFYSDIINKSIECNSVIFMDTTAIKETEKFYDCRLNRSKALVINLPMKVRGLDYSIIEQKFKSKTFNILSIARAEFPFKGYLVGLIEEFEKLCSLNSNLNLTILTFGKDKDRVIERINKLPKVVKDKVVIVGQTPYEGLKMYFDNSRIYIGMGTTVLDAVNFGVPSLLAPQYTYENYTSGFFHHQPNLLVADSNIRRQICTVVQNVQNMGKKEYIELCEKEHAALAEFYDVNIMIDFLKQDSQLNDCSKITSRHLLIHRFFRVITNSMRKLNFK